MRNRQGTLRRDSRSSPAGVGAGPAKPAAGRNFTGNPHLAVRGQRHRILGGAVQAARGTGCRRPLQLLLAKGLLRMHRQACGGDGGADQLTPASDGTSAFGLF